MNTITIISDLGGQHPALTVFKAQVKAQTNAEVAIAKADVYRKNLLEAAYLLDYLIQLMPASSIILADIRNDLFAFGPPLLAKINDHWILTANNGLLSVLNQSHTPDVLALPFPKPEAAGTMPLLSVFLPICTQLLKEKKPNNQWYIFQDYKQASRFLPFFDQDRLVATVISIDNWGNAISNITKAWFDLNVGKRLFRIEIGREHITNISLAYGQVSQARILAFFNEANHLCIGIKDGHAARLLNLSYDAQFTINISQQSVALF